MGFRSIYENIRSRGLRDILNLKKIKVYLISLLINRVGLTLQHGEVLSYSEQLVYRSIKCRPCFIEGKCIDCKCPQPDAAIVQESYCSMGNYGKMLPKDEWDNFKKENKIRFNYE